MQVIPLIAVTDLAFSLDSVTTAIAAIFAAGALIFVFVQFGRQLIVEYDLTRPLQNLIWPIIVVCLLADSF